MHSFSHGCNRYSDQVWRESHQPFTTAQATSYTALWYRVARLSYQFNPVTTVPSEISIWRQIVSLGKKKSVSRQMWRCLRENSPIWLNRHRRLRIWSQIVDWSRFEKDNFNLTSNVTIWSKKKSISRQMWRCLRENSPIWLNRHRRLRIWSEIVDWSRFEKDNFNFMSNGTIWREKKNQFHVIFLKIVQFG